MIQEKTKFVSSTPARKKTRNVETGSKIDVFSDLDLPLMFIYVGWICHSILSLQDPSKILGKCNFKFNLTQKPF